jgi:hypothetical protein
MSYMNHLENRIKSWSGITGVSWYALSDDEDFIKSLVNNASHDSIKAYLTENYPEYFEEEEPYCCGAVAPTKVSIAYGTAMATCSKCNYRNPYWDCPCELKHNCKEWN